MTKSEIRQTLMEIEQTFFHFMNASRENEDEFLQKVMELENKIVELGQEE